MPEQGWLPTLEPAPEPTPEPAWPPTVAAAHSRIAAVRPAAYARTRKHIEGAVTGLSPYITHGLVSLPQVLAGVAARHALHVQHKFVYELGWRAYFRHVWQHRGPAILQSLHTGPLPDNACAPDLPCDLRQARTGLTVVDEAVRTLYRTGMLHNHARMWLASYVVHVRKVHWRAGADWLYGHLLDGDLASNHLSWQWVAGTGSHKPYLFNADNFARYAPMPWHSPGSVIDTSHESLDRLARQPAKPPVTQPPPKRAAAIGCHRAVEPDLLTTPPQALGLVPPNAAAVAGREVWLVHPWNLGELPPALPADTLVLGLFVADFHQAWPWSLRRWQFVVQRMAELAPGCWFGDASAIASALQHARRVRGIDEPHLAPWLSRWATCDAAPQLFASVDRHCGSFSQWWSRTTRGVTSVADLLAAHKAPAW